MRNQGKHVRTRERRIKRLMTKALALVGAAALVGGVLSVTSALVDSTPASATDNHDTECVVDTYQEYKYSKVIPGNEETKHTEWRFRTRTVTYGEIEHKYIKSTYDFVDGGTTRVNGQTVSGHWVGGNANAWRPIPDSIINAVWGSGGIPNQYIGGSETNPKGSVNLSTYGGPNVNVSYYAAKESEPTGYTGWGPWSGWSTTNPGTETDTMQVQSTQVGDGNATPDRTVFYLSGGGQSDTNTDANWTRETPGGSWTQIDQRERKTQSGDCTPRVKLDGIAVCSAGTYTVTWTVTITNSGLLSEVDLKVIKHLPAGSLINGVDAQVWLTEWIEHHANHGLPPWPTNGVVTFTQTGIPGSATSATAGVQYDFKGGPSGDPEKTITLSGDCYESKTVTPSLSYTPGTCTTLGTVTAIDTADYTWTREGPDAAATFTAHPANPGITLTQTAFGPYDLRKQVGEDCEPPLPVAATLTSSYVCSAVYNTAELVGERGANIVYVIDGQRIPQADIPYAPFSAEALLEGHGVTVQYGHQYTVTVLVEDEDNQWPSRQDENGDVELGTFQLTLVEPFECPVTYTPEVKTTPGTCTATGTVTPVDTPYATWKVTGPETARIVTFTPTGDHVTLTKTTFGPFDVSKTAAAKCDTPPPLAYTGVDSGQTLLIGLGGIALLLAGGAMVLFRWRRRSA